MVKSVDDEDTHGYSVLISRKLQYLAIFWYQRYQISQLLNYINNTKTMCTKCEQLLYLVEHIISSHNLEGPHIKCCETVNINSCVPFWPPLWSSGQSSWLQIRRPGFDSRHYQKKKCSGSETGSTQPREYNWGDTW
jgi:ribosomal protein L37E